MTADNSSYCFGAQLMFPRRVCGGTYDRFKTVILRNLCALKHDGMLQ